MFAQAPSGTHTLLLPAMLLLGLGLIVVAETGGLPVPQFGATARVGSPASVVLAPRDFAFRAGGDFEQAGVPVSSPQVTVRLAAPLEIMVYQVGAADYARCVADGACGPARPRHTGSGDIPAAGVSFNDAQSYATWLSRQTGESWRLPTLEEWDFAAAGMAEDHGLQEAADVSDPSKLWLSAFDDQSAEARGSNPGLRARGSFGFNALGVADMGGSVWEWTSSCNARTRLDPSGAVAGRVEACGVRLLEGKHRMPMSGFVQDARGGACSTGLPPDNLGFRLVREPRWYDQIADVATRLWRHVS